MHYYKQHAKIAPSSFCYRILVWRTKWDMFPWQTRQAFRRIRFELRCNQESNKEERPKLPIRGFYLPAVTKTYWPTGKIQCLVKSGKDLRTCPKNGWKIKLVPSLEKLRYECVHYFENICAYHRPKECTQQPLLCKIGCHLSSAHENFLSERW